MQRKFEKMFTQQQASNNNYQVQSLKTNTIHVWCAATEIFPSFGKVHSFCRIYGNN